MKEKRSFKVSTNRAPRIRMENSKIFCKSEVKYPGVWLDKNLVWDRHVREIRNKVKNLAGKIFNIGRRKWGDKWFV